MTVALSVAGRASAATTCTLVVDAATGATLVRVGDRCDERLTPASTFKIALSLIGFDSGILHDADRPAWPYKDEYKVSNNDWKQTTTPRTWLRDSVVWYSQADACRCDQVGACRLVCVTRAYRVAVATRKPGNCLRCYSDDSRASSAQFAVTCAPGSKCRRCFVASRTHGWKRRGGIASPISGFAVCSACSHASATRYALVEDLHRHASV